MLLLPGNGVLPVKLDRSTGNVRRFINGIYSITDGVLFRQVSDPIVIMNGVEISMCGDRSRFLSDIISESEIKITRLTRGRCNGLLEDRLDTAAFYRINTANEYAILTLYDRNVSLIAEMKYEKFYLFRKRIDFSGVILPKKETVDHFEDFFNSFEFSDSSAIQD